MTTTQNIDNRKMNEKNIKTIDLDRIIKERNSKLLKKTPKFLINYLKKLIHQEEINTIIKKHNHLNTIDFIDAGLKEFNISSKIFGEENIIHSTDEKYIFVANHPLGGFDGLLFISYINRNIGPAKAMINDLLLNIQKLSGVFLGVNSYGKKSKESFKQIESLFSSNEHLLLFPAGLVSRKIKGKVQDLEWKSTFVKQAIKHKRNIIPVHITGKLSKFFYNLYSFRNFLGIKFNFELIYLSDETFKLKDKVFNLTFGKPINYKSLNERFTPNQWANEIKKHVYKLENNPYTTFPYNEE